MHQSCYAALFPSLFPPTMRILLLCEGDAAHPHAFSGTARSILLHFRAAGDEVLYDDCDVAGVSRLLAAVPVFSPDKRRWVSRYHLGAWPARLRSRRAQGIYKRLGRDIDAVLQFGATFRIRPSLGVPVFLYCDSNIRAAERATRTGYSWASSLRPEELESVARREALVYRSSKAIFTLSEYLRQIFLTDFGEPTDKVVAVGAGPNLEIANIPVREKLAAGPPTILFVGAEFNRKGGDLLLRAFRSVRERLPEARLVIIGPRDLRPEQPGVESLGFLRKDVAEELYRLHQAYASAHVFCLPTRFEPFGIAYIEAMLHGLPCIGPRAWAVPEMVQDGRTGYLVPPEDADAIAERLLHLLQNPEEAWKLGQAGRRFAANTFTWTNTVSAMRNRIARELGQ